MSTTKTRLTQKGKVQIEHNGFLYNQKRANKFKIIWVCNQSSCNSKATTSKNPEEFEITFILTVSEHNHSSLVNQIKKQEMETKMKEKMVITERSSRNVINKILEGTGTELISLFPNYDSTSKLLRRFRNKIINPEPFIYPSLGLGEFITSTILKSSFYRYGPVNLSCSIVNSDILIFFSDTALNDLYLETVWCTDGTFSVVPDPYYQLYSVSYIKNYIVFPCIFVLMKNRRKETYIDIFRILIELKGRVAPNYLKTDFETASFSAFKEVYPETIISGCQFHLGQAIQRRIQSIGLIKTYKEDLNFKIFTKCLVALTYVNPNYVLPLFESISCHPSLPITLHPIYDYFKRNFIIGATNTRFDIDIWNSFHSFRDDNVIRTNNAIEGWHSAFKKSFSGSQSSFILLIHKLRAEEDLIRIRRIRLNLNHTFSRKKKYIEMENDVRNFLNTHSIGINDTILLIELAKLLFY